MRKPISLLSLSTLVLLVAACGGGGGQIQFIAKSPDGSMFGRFAETLQRGANAKGCKVEIREGKSGNDGRSLSLSCSKPEHRYVGIVEKTVDTFSWHCSSMSESECKAFVEEILAAGK